jgi:uncharacterized protein
VTVIGEHDEHVDSPTTNPNLKIIDELECRALLSTKRIGRVAYVSNELPRIVPVNYMVLEDYIVFRSDPGDKLSHVPLRHVCFEADGPDDFDRAWSVIVHGMARDVTTVLDEKFLRLRRTEFPSFTPLSDPHWLAISMDQITGRRLAR